MTAKRHVVIFVKAPRLGVVKTRLARGIGATRAWAFQRRTTDALLRRLASDRRWRTIVAVTPDRLAAAGTRPPSWPRTLTLMPQGGGDLGQRMARPMRRLAPGPVIIVGSDIPDLAPDHIWRAFRALGDHDAVFGPAADGGYWLVGLKRRTVPGALFEGVRWSGPHALADTIATLGPRASVAMLETLHDIDTADDLAQWRAAEAGRDATD